MIKINLLPQRKPKRQAEPGSGPPAPPYQTAGLAKALRDERNTSSRPVLSALR